MQVKRNQGILGHYSKEKMPDGIKGGETYSRSRKKGKNNIEYKKIPQRKRKK